MTFCISCSSYISIAIVCYVLSATGYIACTVQYHLVLTVGLPIFSEYNFFLLIAFQCLLFCEPGLYLSYIYTQSCVN